MAENEKETAFAEIMDRLAKELIPPEEQPTVTAKAVEATAKAMISKGYEITSRTLEVLADYLKGYNIWLCGNVGTGKTFFFETMSRVRADSQESRRRVIFGEKKESELLERLRASSAYGNQQPSSVWRGTPIREGSTTIPQGSRRKRVEVLHLGNKMMI